MKNICPYDIIIEINSDDILEKFQNLNLRKRVKGGLVIRKNKIAIPFKTSHPHVGDKIILMGVDAAISQAVEQLKVN